MDYTILPKLKLSIKVQVCVWLSNSWVWIKLFPAGTISQHPVHESLYKLSGCELEFICCKEFSNEGF